MCLICLVNLLEFSSTDPVAIEADYDDNKENSTSDLSSEPPMDLSAASELLDDVKTKDSYRVIPYFYHKLPKSNDVLAQKLREEARTLFLQKRSKELLDNNELKTLWNILQKNYTQPTINNEQFINYDDYLRVVKIAGEKFK